MVAIVSDELKEKIEADALLTFSYEVKDAMELYKNFQELSLLEKDSNKIVLLRTQPFKICNQMPFDITLITGYPNAETIFRVEAEATVKEIDWQDYKRLQRDSLPDSEDEGNEDF